MRYFTRVELNDIARSIGCQVLAELTRNRTEATCWFTFNDMNSSEVTERFHSLPAAAVRLSKELDQVAWQTKRSCDGYRTLQEMAPQLSESTVKGIIDYYQSLAAEIRLWAGSVERQSVECCALCGTQQGQEETSK